MSARPATKERAYTVATLAGRWDCSEGVIRKLIGDERLICFRVGSLIRIAADEVRRFESQNTQSSGSAAASPSSIEEPTESATERDYEPPIALGLKRKHDADGPQGATILPGRWGEL